MSWIIQQLNIPENYLIIDPYMGSGTTIRAAKDAGFQSIGIEIEEKYCEVAARRLQQEVFAFNESEPGAFAPGLRHRPQPLGNLPMPVEKSLS